MTILRILRIIVLILPVFIGTVQLYLSNTNTLSAWKGGGFGMYTSPHPFKYRSMYLVNDDNSWIRIFPRDSRLDSLSNSQYKFRINRIIGVAQEEINFPTIIDFETLKFELNELRSNFLTEKVIYYPSQSVKLQVVEMGISANFGSIEKCILFEKRIWLKE